jgi:hypothetical protein
MENKMQKHLTAVAALQIGYSILMIIAALVVYIVLPNVARFVEESEIADFLPLIAIWILVFLLVISTPSLIGGFGLLMKKYWARYVVLIFSMFQIFNFPVGTAIAVYTIWVLVQDDTARLLGKQNSAAA